ncbi:MAG TPA: tetratricopeptide repeat protein [Chitinophagaceae bacterium]
MRILLSLLLLFVLTGSASGQKANRKANAQNDIQTGMNQATGELKKQIAELEKQLKTETDPDVIKDLKEQIEILKKQLDMMQGLNKNVSMMSDNAVQEAVEDDGSAAVPKRDMTRISMLPKKLLNEAELLLFIKNIQAEVDKIIPPSEKAEALKMYNETKAEYNSIAIIANAASGCWMMGNWEKAIFIMGKVCVDDMSDADNLNNYAAFLIDAGAEQAAIPILEYLDSKYPNNSTILNNIGQAWYGLGDMNNASKFLNAAIELYPNHSMANLTMSSVTLGGPDPDTPRAINFLKTSLKENYDTEKETELEKLGYTITLEDMPELKYPMKSDPIGILQFVESFPEEFPSRIDDGDKVKAINQYVLGIKKLKEEYKEEQLFIEKKLEIHGKMLTTNPQYRENYLKPHHNSPAAKIAIRSHALVTQKKIGAAKNVKTIQEVWTECQDIWAQNVTEPLARLSRAWESSNKGVTCSDVDAATNAYLAEESKIRKKGIKLIKAKLDASSTSIDEWTKIVLYSGMGSPPKDENQLAMDLVSQLDFTMTRKGYRNGEIYYMIDMAQKFIEAQAKKKSACTNDFIPDTDPDLVPLVPVNPLKIDVQCEFKKVITTTVVLYTFECNAVNETTKKNMKSKNDPVNKGKAYSGKGKSGSRGGPPRGGKGPFIFYDDESELENLTTSKAPLSAEDEDLSQFSIEYDRWGNLSGLNVQLNKDGTSLADPDSAELGIDSRWSWNAVASPKKGFLYKLIIK